MIKRLLILALFFTACTEDNPATTVDKDEVNYTFEDGFETSENELSELFPNDDSRWTNIQLVDPENGNNEINLETSTILSGSSSLRIYAEASDNVLSKADIEKGGFSAPEGSTIKITANFYIASTANIENLLLIDLECCSCWDPDVPDNQCPGIRLMMKENDFLSIERGKILGSTIVQSNITFPRNEWVNVVWELALSSENDGMNKLQLNGQEVISESGMNMPNADIFRAEFAKNGIGFELQEPLFYERFQIGATANPTKHNIELLIDDVKLEIK